MRVCSRSGAASALPGIAFGQGADFHPFDSKASGVKTPPLRFHPQKRTFLLGRE